MKVSTKYNSKYHPNHLPYGTDHYKEIKRNNIIRLVITYIVPLILLTIYFLIQYNALASESRKIQIKAIAENQSNTLDLFLWERIVNLLNLIEDPKFDLNPDQNHMYNYLQDLKKSSETFIDISYFNSNGIQTAYSGPYPWLEDRDYSEESWYVKLKNENNNFIITDIYLGFRKKAHFTIAVNKKFKDQYIVLRATIEPEKINEYIHTLEGSNEVITSIVSKDGYFQVTAPDIGTPLEFSPVIPPNSPRLGTIKNESITYAYSWLKRAEWALIIQYANDESGTKLSEFSYKTAAISAVVIFIIFLIIINRAKKLVTIQMESDMSRNQLEHAAKLASVGELAAGIAHEINNPLASINEEAGLMKDLISQEYGQKISQEEILQYLDSIQDSVFRCRDITLKLLAFVRKTDIELTKHDIHDLIESVIQGFLGKRIEVSNIEVIKNYDRNIPLIDTDGNKLQQVFLNIMNNALDAMEGKDGKITINTFLDNNFLKISITDNGSGMGKEELNKMFMPFFTTKGVGKGTGLGLSVSYGIIKSLKGEIKVSSALGEGSTFTVILPIK